MGFVLADTSAAPNLEQDNNYSDPTAAGTWIDKLVTTRSINSPFKLQKFLDNIYIVDQSLDWKPNKGQEYLKPVIVPKGFVTDLASIPREFWSILDPADDYAYAAVVHDYLYWTQLTTKNEADLILKFAMQDLDVSPTTVDVIYTAVDMFGQQAWNQNKRLKELGEKRLLKKFPPNAAIKWADWKSQDVY